MAVLEILTAPDPRLKVKAEKVRDITTVQSALDREGKPITIESDEFLAIVMQHEIDHLSGNLFIDYLSPLKRQMAMKKVKKYVKAHS
ncbi:peptide deformylase [Vibrio parahaemolyticus]|nr:peptide deformylase [Vibrio parahaemolyticus]